MRTVGEIYDVLDTYCDFNNQEPWDNSGLLVGDRNQKVDKIMVTLDITSDVVIQAKQQGVQLIVSHHPVIFKPLKSLNTNDAVYMLAHFGIAAICAHTCLDAARGGVNDVLADILKLHDVEAVASKETSTMLLRVGFTDKEYSPEAFARYVGQRLHTKVLLSNADKNINKVMLCTGSGGEFFNDARLHGCQALVTGEAGYHNMIDSANLGVTLIAAGHFETENPIVDTLINFLQDKFAELETVKAYRKTPVEII